MTILYSVLALGGLGLLFGFVLTAAAKKFHVDVDERVARVREQLGGANCGACGYAGCDAFAAAVVRGEAKPTACAPAGAEGAKRIAAVMGITVEPVERQVARVLCQGVKGVARERYVYDGYKSCAVAAGIAGGPKDCRFACIGLGDCMDHCAFHAITMADGVACIDESKCAACGVCVQSCPRHVIRLMPVSQNVIVRCRNSDTAREARAVCMKACIGCGRCVKECKYGAIVVENGFAHIDAEKCVRCGECVAVCPCKCITLE